MPHAGGDEATEQLAAAAAAGDEVALARLLALIEPTVLALCGRFLPNWADAEEACQDTLLAVARTIDRFESRARFSTWLHQVTANRARSTYRALKRHARPPNAIAAEQPDPRTTSVIAGSRLDLLDALDRIGTSYAQALALRDVLDLEYAEIAAAQRVPVGTVKSRVHEGRRRLQRLLDGEEISWRSPNQRAVGGDT